MAMTDERRKETPEEKQFGAAAAAYEKKRISQIIHDKKAEFGKLPDSDYEIVSRNIWKMLERLKTERGAKKSAIRPSKRGSEYATAPGRAAPSKRLKRKFTTLFKFVKMVQDLYPDSGDLVVEVFADAQFWRKFQRSADSRHVKLMQDICLVMNAVAQKTELQKYFRTVRDFGGVFTPTIAECHAGMDASWSEHQVEMMFVLFCDDRQNWPIELAQPAREVEDHNGDSIAAYPLVDLGGWRIGDVFPIAIAASIPTEEGCFTEISGVVLGRTLASLQLCIIPTGSDLEPTPALRVALTTRLDALTEVMVHGEAPDTSSSALRELLSFPWVNIPAISRGTTLIPARIPAGSVDCECRATVDVDVLPEPFGGYFPVPEAAVQRLNWAGATRFFPLTGQVCLDWFGLPLRDSLGTSLRTRPADWVNPVPLTERGVAESGGEFEPGSLANAIDAYLRDPEHGLDQELEFSARSRIALVEQTIAEVRQAREAGWQKVVERLGNPAKLRPAGDHDKTVGNSGR